MNKPDLAPVLLAFLAVGATLITGCVASSSPSSSQNASTRNYRNVSERLSIVGDHLYALDNMSARRFQIGGADADPLNPTEVSAATFGRRVFGVRSESSTLITAIANGMGVYTADDAGVHFTGSLPIPSGKHDALMIGDYAYVISRHDTRIPDFIASELRVIDVSSTFRPSVVQTELLYFPESIAAINSGLAICDSAGGMKYFNLNSPSAPVQQDIVGSALQSGFCSLISSSPSTLYRLQDNGLDRIEVVASELSRVGRLEF